ncbi:hypothetical protein [Polaribacter sp. HL-MS24]|uniref:hypothetical protein n=1 Tax=Polaribacter sp. HL-MS24 TaxID=3077735 RepID=UPI0029351D7D|nr:hypothetical protein [Polaribacter sp. HL-MS24]WOC40026.1 hypothetical protein RRF69_10455 [Polaribacter sp. HL-MS24]
MKQRAKQFITLLFLTFSLLTSAQIYPVQVTPQLIPPHSLKLSHYQTTSSEKLFVNLLLSDTQELGRQVRLKMYIEGQGLNIQTLDFVAGATPIFLDGGINQRLSNLDLRPYFNLNNLLGLSPQQYNQALPDGRYNFCFEVYDFLSGQRLSRKSCFPVYLILNDPPILIKPQRGDQIVLKNQLNIFFEWQSRSTTATNLSYEFEIRELWDEQMDPQAAFLASPPLYKETTRANAFLYDNTKPALLPDKTYAWRVRAISTSGIDENAVFKNNGHSEIFHFRLTKDCDTPKFPLSEATNQSTVKINWQGNFEHNKYHVQYRKVSYTQETDKQRKRREKKNKKRARKGQKQKDYVPKKEKHQWFEVYTSNEQAQISNLEAGVTYEFRVGGTCSSLASLNQYYSYTSENQFTMPTNEETVSYNCGVVPDIQINNQTPLQNIGVNETFTAGDFPVTVKEVQNNGGKFTGKGFIIVPYLADTKLAVAFEGITINTDYQLVDGVVKTTYDPDWENVESVKAAVREIKQLIKDIFEALKKKQEDATLSEEEVQEIKEDLSKQEAKLTQEEEALKKVREALDSAKQKADKEAIAVAEKEIAQKISTVAQVQEAVNNIAQKLGVGTSDGTVGNGDGYFDGSYSFTDPSNEIVVPDGERISIPVDQALRDTLFVNKTFTLERKPYRIVITTDTSPKDKQQLARELTNNPEGTTLHYHYDFAQNQLFYKVTFSDGFFGDLKGEIAEVKSLHKNAISNLIELDRTPKNLSNDIFKAVLEINRLFSSFIDGIQLPECFWNPSVEVACQSVFRLSIKPNNAGIIDGIAEEVKGIPLLLSLYIEYRFDEQARKRIHKALDDFEFKKALEKWVESKVDQYSGSSEEINYQIHKDLVAVTTTFVSGGILNLSKTKKGANLVEDLAKGVKRWGDETGGYLANVTRYRQLFKAGKVKELFEEFKKTHAPPELGKTIRRNHSDVKVEYHQRYGKNATNYPHSTAHSITRFELAETAYFARLHIKGQKPTRWLTRIEDFKAFKGNIKEITEKLALPGEPTHFSLVEVPKGTSLHKSVAGPQKWYDKNKNLMSKPEGGAVQYEVLDWEKLEEITIRDNWFKEVGRINN